MKDRIAALREAADLSEGRAALVSKPSNVFYLSGFTGEGTLLLTPFSQTIITDSRYTEQAEKQAAGFQVEMTLKGVSRSSIVYRVLKNEGCRELLYEDDEYTVRAFSEMQQEMQEVSFLSLSNVPERLRTRKDEGEVSLISEACDISCRAFDWLLGEIRPGMTEKTSRMLLENRMLELGADRIAFNTIVASGENGSLPHAVPGDRAFCAGDMITFDFGAKKCGYCADMTRTVALGQPGEEMKRIFAVVLQAQTECEQALAPGKSCREIDSLARKIIYGAGYEGYFGHGLGHGVGIDIHEEPRLSQTSDALLEEGHIVTVEPGIYVPGFGGVRIENTCLITASGARTLVHAQKDLVIL